MSAEMVEVIIDSIRVGLMSQQRVVILREVGMDRYLAIWIDPYMAEQITFALQEIEVARPMSHDLMRNLLLNLEARVQRVEVRELKEDVFFGNIVVESNGHVLNIDARPSDALALAVRVNVPIMVSRQVMEEAGITPEDDMGSEEADLAELPDDEETPVGDERLSVFEDFFDNLELERDDDDSDDDVNEDEDD